MVLLAESEAAVRERLLGLIRAAGHRAEAFASGRALLDRLRRVDGPCCVVSEMEIPELDPVRIRTEPLHATVPVALVF